MPLVIICGYPSSGKTTLSIKLESFLTEKMNQGLLPNCKSVQLVNEESLNILTNDYYSDVNEEKKVRAALLAASERHISRETILIIDSLNYIKGFRYQLYCQARAASTTHLLIHCQAREDTCKLWNRDKSCRKYPGDQLDDLILRFEEPNNQNKWDSPLFGIVTEGATSQDFIALFDSLMPTLTATPNRPPSTATLTNKQSTSSANSNSTSNSSSIQILDQETQNIIDTILKSQQDLLPIVKFANTSKTLALPRPVTVATLSRVRRQFLHLNRLHPISDQERIKNLFIDFLTSNIYL